MRQSVYARVTLDAIRLAQVGLVNTVDLGELDAFLLESSSGFFVMRGQSLAVTTPADTSEIRTKQPRVSLTMVQRTRPGSRTPG